MFRLLANPHLRRRGAVLTAALLFCAVVLAGIVWVSEAQALRLSMKRIIFEGPKRSDILTIMNNTGKEQTYRLGWRHYRMDENKSLVFVNENDPAKAQIKWADSMVTYAPRRVTVPPGGSQQIRLLLRRPRDLAAGEYRSHLWIVTEAEAEAFDPDAEKKTGQQSFRLTMQPALTLPVFVRHGEMTASASITGAKVTRRQDGGTVAFTINRQGNRSLYGDMTVTCVGGGAPFEAHYTRGIAVYPEVSKRVFEFDIKYPPEQAANCARVKIEYVADREDPLFAGKTMAQATTP